MSYQSFSLSRFYLGQYPSESYLRRFVLVEKLGWGNPKHTFRKHSSLCIEELFLFVTIGTLGFHITEYYTLSLNTHRQHHQFLAHPGKLLLSY